MNVWQACGTTDTFGDPIHTTYHDEHGRLRDSFVDLYLCLVPTRHFQMEVSVSMMGVQQRKYRVQGGCIFITSVEFPAQVRCVGNIMHKSPTCIKCCPHTYVLYS